MKSGRQYDVLANSVSEIFNKVELLERRTNDVAHVIAQVSFTFYSVAGSDAEYLVRTTYRERYDRLCALLNTVLYNRFGDPVTHQ